MKKYISVLKNTRLFRGVEDAEIISMLKCLNARPRTYRKGEFIYRQGEHVKDIAVLVEGNIHIQKDDYWGNRSILENLSAADMFGEAYFAPEGEILLNDVVAVEDSTVIFFDIRNIITTCCSACRFHSLVVQNMFYIVSEKNRKLVRKLNHMSKRTTREKLISYLSEESKRQNSNVFTIPFNRQQLADYLSVDRSAMSGELCKMRDEGLLEFEKNRFRLI